MATVWTFGQIGSGFYATVTFDGTNFSVTCVEGAFDLNALWFSDSDGSSGEGGATLPKGDTSLSMDGTKIKWDDYAKLSSTGLKKGQTLGSKSTYFTAGESQTYTLAQLQTTGLNTAWITDWDTITLGLRATSVSGVAGTTSIKYVSTPGTPPPPTPPVLAIAAANANQTEGNSGTTAFTFTVTRTGDTSGTSSATWTVGGGSGSNPADADDFGGTFPTGTVEFSAGEISKTITVNVNGDTDVEEDETFLVTLSAALGASLNPGASSDAGTILNDDIIGPYITGLAWDDNEFGRFVNDFDAISPLVFDILRVDQFFSDGIVNNVIRAEDVNYTLYVNNIPIPLAPADFDISYTTLLGSGTEGLLEFFIYNKDLIGPGDTFYLAGTYGGATAQTAPYTLGE